LEIRGMKQLQLKLKDFPKWVALFDGESMF
jgi:hypothetical protein